MNPFNLLLPDSTPSKVWVCGECRTARPDQYCAMHCCTIVPCKACGEPSGHKFRDPYMSFKCDSCLSVERAKRGVERLEKATNLDDWEGWVWDENRYYSSLGDYVEHLECNFESPDDWPEWVWVAPSRPGVVLKAEHILENVCEDGYEDMADHLKGVPELEAAVKAFNEANADVIVYDGDWSRAVRVPKPTEANP